MCFVINGRYLGRCLSRYLSRWPFIIKVVDINKWITVVLYPGKIKTFFNALIIKYLYYYKIYSSTYTMIEYGR